ncbi:acyl-CoA dehydrogenase family protein [Actinomadura rupiterrae]|uniref:acyl-CoA dehydrogenase family protein n=1 Tax=Actinomadura rupiterrae TaxID=559627 RepID=UPI0020A370FC|nr:acyl-CoA dehydrogenase family protein [Actinomadura rupiterrae]MCP2335640.1 alkylation response protein AidB-like acyl-CoA dehydrogenase [Actinomadura rupiterrae]
MRFVLSEEHRLFAASLDKLLDQADTPSAIRAWSSGDHAPGRRIWTSLAETGVFALAVPEEHDGMGLLPVELVTAMHGLGRHAVPGPLVETIAAASLLTALGDTRWLPRIAAGEALVTLAAPYALDADVADLVLTVQDGEVYEATPARALRPSIDPSRRLYEVTPTRKLGPADDSSLHLATLACAAQHLGVGRRLLELSVDYAKTRSQYGHPIGEYQAVKHHLANALIDLEFARPLVHAAALSHGTSDFPRDTSAAKIAASEAAYRTAKTALQVHGAIAYTAEYAPSLWIRKSRALLTTWGSPTTHRATLINTL